MGTGFLLHLQHNWPLAVVVAGLALFIPAVLLFGVFPSNQGNVVRSLDPITYWRWVRRFVALFVVSSAVLVGSFFLSAK
jgi:hypothetical protein